MNTEKTWYIEENGIKTFYTNWAEAIENWKKIEDYKIAYLCRKNGTVLDCKGF